MSQISLQTMTKEFCRTYMREFVADPCLFQDPSKYKLYTYKESDCDAYFQRHQSLGRIHTAVMLDMEPIGEVILKSIDHKEKCCTLSISMKNDTFKNKGYGTHAEILALEYAFETLAMETVYADALKTNERS